MFISEVQESKPSHSKHMQTSASIISANNPRWPKKATWIISKSSCEDSAHEEAKAIHMDKPNITGAGREYFSWGREERANMVRKGRWKISRCGWKAVFQALTEGNLRKGECVLSTYSFAIAAKNQTQICIPILFCPDWENTRAICNGFENICKVSSHPDRPSTGTWTKLCISEVSLNNYQGLIDHQTGKTFSCNSNKRMLRGKHY